MLRYYKRFYDRDDAVEIGYDEALDTLLTTYKDNDMTRDMLKIVNRIQCRFSEITIENDCGDGNAVVLMAGMYNMLPLGEAYDDDGNRLER